MKPFQPGKDNTYATSQYNNIQNMSRNLVLHHDTIQHRYIAQPKFQILAALIVLRADQVG